MIEERAYAFDAPEQVRGRAHVGVVASGDCELLLEPASDARATVTVRTSVGGYEHLWRAVFERFFERHGVAVRIEIEDFGATPAVVALRLEQALEQAR